MRYGEALHMAPGTILVCRINTQTALGKFSNVDNNQNVIVYDVWDGEGNPLPDVGFFICERTNVADAKQVELYNKFHKHKEIGGTHYEQMAIQPIEYIHKNNLSFDAGNVVKYVTRYKHKNGAEDIKKAMQYLGYILENEYNIVTSTTFKDKK